MLDSKTIFTALLAGRTLVDQTECKLFLKNDELYIMENNISDLAGTNPVTCFSKWIDPTRWSILPINGWYEDIPTGGILCWVWDDDSDEDIAEAVIAVISSRSYSGKELQRRSHYVSDISNCYWIYAHPLSSMELAAFTLNQSQLNFCPEERNLTIEEDLIDPYASEVDDESLLRSD